MEKYPVETLVWVKQPEYPWWPGKVVDPAMTGATLMEGFDVCVMFLPTAAASLSFANSNDEEQIVPFYGPGKDDDKISAGKELPDCNEAIEEALNIFHHGVANGDNEEQTMEDKDAANHTDENSGDENSKSEEDSEKELDATVDDNAAEAGSNGAVEATLEVLTDQIKEKRHKKDKKSKKDKKDKKHKKDKHKHKKKHEKRHREYDEGESDAFQLTSSHSKRSKRERQTILEDYPSKRTNAAFGREDHSEYLYDLFYNSRREVTNEELEEINSKLSELLNTNVGYSQSPENRALFEEKVLDLLRVLSSIDVNIDQLKEIGVGRTVGGFLDKRYSLAVKLLADAILKYWLSTLSEDVQNQLHDTKEIDNCSNDTEGQISDTENVDLDVAGIHMFNCFTEEDLYDAPMDLNLYALCAELEDSLKDAEADSRAMVLASLSDPKNTALRRLILDGIITPRDVAENMTDLNGLVSLHQGGGAAASFDSPSSPLMRVGSPTGASFSSPTTYQPFGDEFTALYECPKCGAKDAEKSAYAVQAHDNFPVILKCRKCNNIWNLAEGA